VVSALHRGDVVDVLARSFAGGLLLQLDISHRVLRTDTVYTLLADLTRRKVPDIKSEAEKLLLGESVLTR